MTDENDEGGHLLYLCHRAAGIKAHWLPLPPWETLSPYQQQVWGHTAAMFRSGTVTEPEPTPAPVFQPPEPLNRAGPVIDEPFWPTNLPVLPLPDPDPNLSSGVEPSLLAKIPPRPQSPPMEPPPIKWK